jgi:hypothetical protein
MGTFSCEQTLDTLIVIYDCPDYKGYTLFATRMQVLRCYFTIILIYIV